MAEENISIREFARRLNVDEKAVRKAIESFKIVNGVGKKDNGRPFIIYAVALKEWEANYNVDKNARTKGGAMDFEAAKKNTYRKPETEEEVDEQESQRKDQQASNQASSTAKINQQRSTVKLQHEALKLKKEMGLLIEKDKVNKALFEAGKEIRESLLIIADRVIDEIRACDSRHEAHEILYKEIERSLEKLSRMDFSQAEETAA